jgi:hypothetical protein
VKKESCMSFNVVVKRCKMVRCVLMRVCLCVRIRKKTQTSEYFTLH